MAWLLILVGIKFSWILLGLLFIKFHMYGVRVYLYHLVFRH